MEDDAPAFNLRPRGGTPATPRTNTPRTTTPSVASPTRNSRVAGRITAKSPRFDPYAKAHASPRTPKGSSLTKMLEKKMGMGDKFFGQGDTPRRGAAAMAAMMEPDVDAIPITPAAADGPSVPLENEWCFYFHKFAPGLSADEYEKSIRKLHTFNTVEGFWSVFNNIPTIVQLTIKSSYHMMKGGLKPLWEDPANIAGGKWSFKIDKEYAQHVWRELCLAAVGEQLAMTLDKGDAVHGITISVRDRYAVCEVWNKDSTSTPNPLMDRIRQMLGRIEPREVFYRAHQTHQNFSGR